MSIRNAASASLLTAAVLASVTATPYQATAAVNLAAHGSHKSDCQMTVSQKPHWQRRCKQVQLISHRVIQGPNASTLWALHRLAKIGGVSYETDQWNLASSSGAYSQGQPVMTHNETFAGEATSASMQRAGITAHTLVGDVKLSQFKKLRTLRGKRFATEYQFIRLAGKLGLSGIIEGKYTPVNPSRVVHLVQRFRAKVSYYFAPQNVRTKYPCSLTGAKSMIAVGMPTGLKYYAPCPMSLKTMSSIGYSFVALPTGMITRRYIRAAHKKRIAVGNIDSRSSSVWGKVVNAGSDFVMGQPASVMKKWARG